MLKKRTLKQYGVSKWYSTLADYTFPTTFVKLKETELDLLAQGIVDECEVYHIVNRIAHAQQAFFGSKFVFADTIAPTDTTRFISKRGSIHSAASAWKNLASSEKVRTAAKNREFECICVRPFRSMNRSREFRLFINEGNLILMSQYWLDRHYHKLESKKDFYWTKAEELLDEISWLLPKETIVLDLYFTSKDQIILIDFNPWGPPTLPLLAESWNIDWTEEIGIKIVQPEDQTII